MFDPDDCSVGFDDPDCSGDEGVGFASFVRATAAAAAHLFRSYYTLPLPPFVERRP